MASRPEPKNLRKWLLILALLVVIWIPLTLVIVYRRGGELRWPDRHMGVVMVSDLLIGVISTALVYRRWISRVK